MAVSIEDIIKKEFAHSFMGYDMQEVDVFLDAIIDRMEKMELERADMSAAMERLLKKVERLERAVAAKEKEQAPAIEAGEPQPARKISPPAASGPVRVQGTRASVQTAAPEKPQKRAERAAEPSNVRTVRVAPTAPPPVQPQTPPPAQQPAAPQWAEVAVELETGAAAPDPETLIPELITGVEEAILERSVRAASQTEESLRTEKSCVS